MNLENILNGIKKAALATGLTAALMLGGVKYTKAEIVTVNLEAQVNYIIEDPAGIFENKIVPGTEITGKYVYNTNVIDRDFVGGYTSENFGSYWFDKMPYGILLESEGFVFQTDPNNVDFKIDIINDNRRSDSFTLKSYNNLPLSAMSIIEDISWQLADYSGNAHNSDALLEGPPILENYPDVPDYLMIDGYAQRDPNCSGPRCPYDYFLIRAEVTKAELSSDSATPVSLEIIGENALEKYPNEYIANAIYDDGTIQGVTKKATWRLNLEGIATINEGILISEDIDEIKDVNIYAEYTEDEVTVRAEKSIRIILDNPMIVPDDYLTIQDAINAAINRQTVSISDGVYNGLGNRDISFLGKQITVKSRNGLENCIIDCEDRGRSFYFINNENNSSIIQDLTILNSSQILCDMTRPLINNCYFNNTTGASLGGVSADNGASPTVANCEFTAVKGLKGNLVNGNHHSHIIVENCKFTGGDQTAIRTEYGSWATIEGCEIYDIYGTVAYHAPPAIWVGSGDTGYEITSTINNCIVANNFSNRWCAGIWVTRNSAILNNCTIINNQSNEQGGGVGGYGANIWIYDSIIRDNETWDGAPGPQYSREWGGSISFYNCNVQGLYFDFDPLFADPNNNDFHLKSQAGRYDKNTQAWKLDDVTSPCIDAGNPTSPIMYEPFPNGGRINIGAYGGTAEASKSYFGKLPCETIVAGDINGDCIVDFKDFSFIVGNWLREEE